MYARPHEKSIQFVGEDGTLVWEPNLIKIGKKMEPEWEVEEFDYDRNDMFISVAEEFLNILGGDLKPSCDIDDGIRVLALIEAARQSSSTEKAVKLETL